MLSCKKATALIDKKYEQNLSFKEGFQLKLHILMCDACCVYEKQSKLISKALSKFFQTKVSVDKDTIENKKLKEKIISKL